VIYLGTLYAGPTRDSDWKPGISMKVRHSRPDGRRQVAVARAEMIRVYQPPWQDDVRANESSRGYLQIKRGGGTEGGWVPFWAGCVGSGNGAEVPVRGRSNRRVPNWYG
jgi:hypothetical protein